MAGGTENFWASFTTFVAPITNFSAMAALVYLGTRKSVPAAFASRSDEVKETMDKAETEFAVAKKDHDHWREQWDGSEGHAKQMKTDAEASMNRVRTDVMAAAEKQAARIEKDAGLLAESEAKRAQKALQQEIADQSVAMVENYCQTSLKTPDQKKLVNRSLESIGG